ncbi:formyl transferase-like protein [Shewanella sediminis HAW-EB3]|uniref:Formyl transferase-like protein n=1 Tax=Shewanella sediminis (strain HAW-EB3) TaxID=425104 RepID=A8FYM9_SHESH|nr:hydrogenase maturation protein [Shewanella sediminis]ABV37952.1 formyl transferase-like protein [Shewanella sediminis HAW-EB3]
MRILLLVTAFNGLTQRVFEQLRLQSHEVRVIFAGCDDEVRDTVSVFRPDIILCPFLKQRIPEDIWNKHLCIIIHPGISGDRGPSSLDWAILNRESEWGVTALQADSEMDAGDIWSTGNFPMRAASKASLYRQEVTEMAAHLVDEIIELFKLRTDALQSNPLSSRFKPQALDYSRADVKGELRPLLKQPQRAIDWSRDSTQTVLDKIRAADSFPGVLDEFCGLPVYLYGAHNEGALKGDKPKQILGQRHGAICVATIDGAVWISHLKRQKRESQSFIKLPATWVLGEAVDTVPELSLKVLPDNNTDTFSEITYSESGSVGYLYFNFHNGAMGTEQCYRLLKAYKAALVRDTRVLVLMGGDDFFSNGIHLNHIEASEDKAESSWLNINAIDDLIEAILETRNKITVAAVRNNAGAGGAMMALACDYIFARDGVVLNPHYKGMGLYGSEYWTYTLPNRVGMEKAAELTESCLPLGAQAAANIGFLDAIFPGDFTAYQFELNKHVTDIAADYQFEQLLANKLQRRDRDEAEKPLAAYRQEELLQMELCFWGEGSQYHAKRYNFVYKVSCGKTPAHLKYDSNKPEIKTSSVSV